MPDTTPSGPRPSPSDAPDRSPPPEPHVLCRLSNGEVITTTPANCAAEGGTVVGQPEPPPADGSGPAAG